MEALWSQPCIALLHKTETCKQEQPVNLLLQAVTLLSPLQADGCGCWCVLLSCAFRASSSQPLGPLKPARHVKPALVRAGAPSAWPLTACPGQSAGQCWTQVLSNTVRC